MEVVSVNEMKELDSKMCLKYGGAFNFANLISKKIAKKIIENEEKSNVLLLTMDKGNSMDAFLIGELLIKEGFNVTALSLKSNYSIDTKKAFDLFSGKVVSEIDNFSDFDFIIDGMIGISLNTKLDLKTIELINKVNSEGKKIYSIDVPTGINSTSGLSMGAFIKCDTLYTIGYIKQGLLLDDALDSYKKLEVIECIDIKPNNFITLTEAKIFKPLFPLRLRNTHKGSYGKAIIIAGSKKYPGASFISYSALLSFMQGVGITKLYIPSCLYDTYAITYPELIVNEIEDLNGAIKFNKEILDNIIKEASSITLGMGMEENSDLKEIILYLLNNYDKTLVLDASALNTISKYKIDLNKKKCNLIITPHLKEFERLSCIKLSNIKENPIDIAVNYAKENNLVLVLKSASTIITDGINTFINTKGKASLAKAGSGDMLAGIISGLSARSSNLTLLSACASFILGRANELASNDKEIETIRPIDTISNIDKVIKEIKNSNI